MNKQEIIKVSSKSKPSKVASYIARAVNNHQEVELHAIGAGAINQAIKAIAIARKYVEKGIDLSCVPAFDTVEIKGRETTSIRLLVKSHVLVA